MNIKKGDNIIVIAGKDKGKKGKIVRVVTATGKVLVEGINMSKKHIKPRKGGEKGRTVEMSFPMNASNVMLVDPKSGKGTRVGKKLIGDKLVRVSKKSGQEI